MIKTHGLTHLSLAVRDPDCSLAFSKSIWGEGVLPRREQHPGSGPFAYVQDPDGYEIEIWYEIPTKVDPK